MQTATSRTFAVDFDPTDLMDFRCADAGPASAVVFPRSAFVGVPGVMPAVVPVTYDGDFPYPHPDAVKYDREAALRERERYNDRHQTV